MFLKLSCLHLPNPTPKIITSIAMIISHAQPIIELSVFAHSLTLLMKPEIQPAISIKSAKDPKTIISFLQELI